MTNRIWDFDVSVIYEPMLSIWTELGENWVQEAEKNERGGLKSTRETTGKAPAVQACGGTESRHA